MRTRRAVPAAFWLLVCSLGAQAGPVIETVAVGNAGNPAHGWLGRGGVSYAYSIGKFEVTAGQYAALLNAVARTDTYGLYHTEMWDDAYGCKIQRKGASGSYAYIVAAAWANRPVNYVDWGDAVRFANWLHNGSPSGAQSSATTEDGSYYLNGATSAAQLLAVTRKANATWVITSEDEWFKAAYHKNDGATANYWMFPTRSDLAPQHELVNPDPGNRANFNDGGYAIGAPYYRTEAGAYANSASPYGTFDQGGNVWEWNESISYDGRGLRGGSFDAGFEPCIDTLRANHSLSGSATNYAEFVGFRVGLVPEPASIAFVVLGVLLFARCRRSARR